MVERPFVELKTMDRGIHLEVCALDIADERYVDLELVDVASSAFSLHARLTCRQVEALIVELQAARAQACPVKMTRRASTDSEAPRPCSGRGASSSAGLRSY